MQNSLTSHFARFRRLFLVRLPALILLLSITCSHAAFSERKVVLGSVVLQEVAEELGLLSFTTTFGAATFDENNDGWPDLLISNHGKPPSIYLNQRGNGFSPQEKILLRLPGSDRHAPAVADYDNDGDQDIYFQHGAKSGRGLGPKELFENTGPGKPFRKVSNDLLADVKGRGRTAIWFDYDADGLLDLYLANAFRKDGPNRLFRNLGNGSFADASSTSGLDLHVSTTSGTVIAGDIDNDGDMDLFLNGDVRPYLLINDGKGSFRDETLERGVRLIDHSWSAAMADYNNDGFLDLYLTRGDEFPLEGAMLGTHRLNFMQMVSAAGDRTDLLTLQADPDALLTFTFYKTLFTSFIDINNIYIGAQGRNPRKANFTVGQGALSGEGIPPQWKPNGSQKGTFIWRKPNTGIWTIAAASGDTAHFHSGGLVTTDSRLYGLQKSGMESAAVPTFPNILLENHDGKFTDVSDLKRLNDPFNGRSSLWLDLDNDGDLDLFIVNAGFNGLGKQPNTVYLNQDGAFKQYRVPMVGEERFGHGDGALTADFNRDGFLDLFIVNGSGALPNNNGPYQLFLNRTQEQNYWIEFNLIGAGKNYTNRDAIGAKIQVQRSSDLKSFWQYILGGSGSNCQSSRIIHFGLGKADKILAHIYWPPSKSYPSGHVKVMQFDRHQFNRTYTVSEL
jgi:hypothetical protein